MVKRQLPLAMVEQLHYATCTFKMDDLLIPEDHSCLSQWVVEITATDEDEGPGEEIGSLHIVRAELDSPDLFPALDAVGDDLEAIGAAVLDVTTGSLREDIEELLESWGRIS